MSTTELTKPPILFLPGTAGFLSFYHSYLLRYLRDRYNIIYIEFPGIQMLPGKPFNLISNLTEVENTLRYVLKSIDTDIYYFGHSWGTCIGNMIIENDKEEKIKKVVLLEPPIMTDVNGRILFNPSDSEKNNWFIKNVYKLLFKSTGMMMYMIRVLMHPFNIYPGNKFFSYLKTNKTMIWLSSNDCLIDYQMSSKIYGFIGCKIITSNTYHGLCIIDKKYKKHIYNIIEFIDKKNVQN